MNDTTQESEIAVRVGDKALHLAGNVLTIDGTSVKLTSMERRMAEVLMGAPGNTVTRSAITEAGWPDGTPQSNSMEVIIGRLRKKLGEHGVGMWTVRGVGYSLSAQEGVA